MAKRNLNEWFYELNDVDEAHLPIPEQRKRRKRWPRHPEYDIWVQQDGTESFDFTYQASRHERGWLLDSLGDMYTNRWIDDVLRLVKGGKEASVYLCRGAPSTGSELVAAKVYRPRMLRNLRNDHLYRENRPHLDAFGHEIIDHGMLRAMQKKSEYGAGLLHTSWIEHEFTALQVLYAAGADVPRPHTCASNAILMEYIGADGMPASPLSALRLEPEETVPLFERVVRNIEIMLANQRVHGDLSAFNILYWEGAITLIDFPQAIHPEQNRSAYRIFERDVTRVCEYFSGLGRGGAREDATDWIKLPLPAHTLWEGREVSPLRPRQLATDLWTAYRYRLQPEVDPRLLDDEDQDVAEWRSAQDK